MLMLVLRMLVKVVELQVVMLLFGRSVELEALLVAKGLFLVVVLVLL
jgi:hypothetical protein